MDIRGLKQRTIRCILFDLSETLWTNKEQSVWEEVIRNRNQGASTLLSAYFPPDHYPMLNYGQLSAQLRLAIAQRYAYWRCRYYDKEPDPFLVLAEACQQMQLPPLEKGQAVALLDAYREPLPDTRELFHDALTTLQELQTRGFLLGCVTDRQYGGSSFLTDLQKIGLLAYFPAHSIIVSADCGQRKPHPSLFLHVLAALNVDPEEAAMVGDFLTRDVAGAKRLNMFAIWKPKIRLFQEYSQAEDAATSPLTHEKLFHYALRQEITMYPEIPFEEIKRFTQPDLIIRDLSELLSLFPQPNHGSRYVLNRP